MSNDTKLSPLASNLLYAGFSLLITVIAVGLAILNYRSPEWGHPPAQTPATAVGNAQFLPTTAEGWFGLSVLVAVLAGVMMFYFLYQALERKTHVKR